MSGHNLLDLDLYGSETPHRPSAERPARPVRSRTQGPRPELPVEDLFTDLVVSGPPRRVASRATLRLSAGAHLAIVAALIFVPLLAPPPPPETRDFVRALLYDPPPPPPPPLPKGSSTAPAKQTAPQKVTPEPEPRKPEIEPPVQTPLEVPIQPEAGVKPSEQFGSPTGSEFGVPEGMEGGVEGGQVGGVPGGVLGGVIGGTGSIVYDYDAPPRPLKITRPIYPQDAFVKKIEGTVVVEILIDANGRVVRARVLQSIPALDNAALQTVQQWMFQPAVKHGRPVSTVAQAPVTFRIF